MEFAVYKVAPNAEGVLIFPVSPQPYIRIRLYVSGTPNQATDWWVIGGDFPRVATREQIGASHRGVMEPEWNKILARVGKQFTEFGPVANELRSLHMDIPVPSGLITALEAR